MTEMRVATLIEESMSGLPGEIPIYYYPWPILTHSQRMPPRATFPTTMKGAQYQSTFHSPNADQAQAQTNRSPRCTGLQSSSRGTPYTLWRLALEDGALALGLDGHCSPTKVIL